MTLPDIVTWAESDAGFYVPATRKPIKLTDRQKAILRHVTTPNGMGRLPYQTIIYSTPKKGGKTGIAALVAEWFGLFVEPPNEIFCVANDFDQAQGRVFKALAESVRLNPHLARRADVQSRVITFDNGTTVTALPSDFAGAAGSNHGLTVWDELWAYTSESARRLYDELTPVPTRRNSIRFIATYAGIEGESDLLWELYQRAKPRSVGKGGEPVPQLCHLDNGAGGNACWERGGLFVYWDHVLRPHPGLTMTPETYHAEQRESLRPNAYLRLHENQWVSGRESFIDLAWWDRCVDPNHRPMLPSRDVLLFVGVDAAVKHDSAAVVGVTPDRASGKIALACHRIWKPNGRVLDLDATIGDYLRQLKRGYRVVACYYDPWQLIALAQQLQQRDGLPMAEYPQSTPNLTAMGQNLYDLIKGGNLIAYPDDDLRRHISHAVAEETARGWKITKLKSRNRIDLTIALAMAALAAVQEPAAETRTVSGVAIVHDARSLFDPVSVDEHRSIPRASRGIESLFD